MADLSVGRRTSPHTVYETLDLRPRGTDLASSRGKDLLPDLRSSVKEVIMSQARGVGEEGTQDLRRKCS